MPHAPFRYKQLSDLVADAAELGVDLPVSSDLSPLSRHVQIGERHTANALAVQPMEGCDGTAHGAPGELTRRRYRRFAAGGAGLLWFEATAVVQEGRANPRQLCITPEAVGDLAALREEALAAGREANGSDHLPYTVLQLTHSGRYARPEGAPRPVLAHHDPLLDAAAGIPADYSLISDDALDQLPEHYVRAARLAREAGFDAVDIKACHRYLLSELLAARTRPGRYGGSYEGRTRLLLTIVRQVREAVPGLALAVRLNVFDAHPFSWGWGVSEDDSATADLSEPLRLIGQLHQEGVVLLNVTAGNPYYSPHINRPFDRNVPGGYVPPEHPLQGVARLMGLAAAVKQAHPSMVILGSGYTWLRQFLGPVAAGVLASGGADLIGLGRAAFAYPDLARDLLRSGKVDAQRVCITCSRCTQIMRDGGCTGCVPFDREVYGPIYAAGRARG